MPEHNSTEFGFADIREGGAARETQTRTPDGPNDESRNVPIFEDEDSVSYLGVRLEKSKGSSGFVPDREKYADYISDRFALELQQKIAVSLLQGDPMLIEGGTSIGKTTTVRKMCAELGWEVHYANLNGATDVEDLMGRYIPNPQKTHPDDPEYIFADGKVTSGLRQEEGKKKVIILDEFNSSAPNILIRLHEVLDALERDGEVVLSEDASEVVNVGRENTKVIALMNPPGRGYFGREPLDPAQLRRWVYQKEATELPENTFAFSTEALFGIGAQIEQMPTEKYLQAADQALSREQLAEIPGIKEILAKYQEFHKAAKELVKQRQVAADQPQPFTFDDRMEPHRISNFVARFYQGDLNETFQSALRYYYVNKLENAEDRQKLEELINHVAYTAPVESRRRGLPETEAETTPESPESTLKSKADREIADILGSPEIPDSVKAALSGETPLPAEIEAQIEAAKGIFGKDFIGPEEAKAAFGIETGVVPAIPFAKEELERAQELGQMLILRLPITMTQINETLKGKVKDGKKLLYHSDESTGKLKDDTWYKDDEFFNEELPQAGWALASKEVVADSTNKNYLEQTNTLINYIQNEVFKGKTLPAEYAEAIAEFNGFMKANPDFADKVTSGDDSIWKPAAAQLESFKITELTRQSPAEALYDIAAYFQTNDERLLENMYTWTKRRVSDGGLVGVGPFDALGASVLRLRPGPRGGFLGVSFSRSH